MARFGVDPALGLGPDAVEAARRRFGGNVLDVGGRRSAVAVLVEQFKSVLVALLAVAAGLSAYFGQVAEAVAVLVVLVLNALIGFVTELRAVRSVEALKRLGTAHARVRRAGRLQTVPAEDLVPGDILLVEGGDVVSADARILKCSRLEADESSLTGESVPVAKEPAAVAALAPLPERSSMLYKGTAVTRGGGEAVVVATGMATELGRISRLVTAATRAPGSDGGTPLERRLDGLAHRLVWLTLGVAVLVTLTGLGSGKEWLVLLETAIALAVATVPEGLPIIATLTLAQGVRRMARRNALVNRLAAVETLGATSVIITDKTGTLTENRMAVASVWLPAGRWGSRPAVRTATALPLAPATSVIRTSARRAGVALASSYDTPSRPRRSASRPSCPPPRGRRGSRGERRRGGRPAGAGPAARGEGGRSRAQRALGAPPRAAPGSVRPQHARHGDHPPAR